MANKDSNKMKICFVMPYHILENKGGGSEVQAMILSKELAQRGFEVSYVSQSIKGKAGKTETIDKVKIKWVKNARYFCWENMLDYYRALKAINPDIIVQRNSSLITGIIGYYAKKYKKKFIWICNDNRVPFKWCLLKNKIRIFSIYKVNLIKFIAFLFDAILNDVFRHWGMKQVSLAFTQNKFQKKILKEEFGLDSYHILSGHEIPRNFYSTKKRIEKKFVLWCGNLGEWKHPEKFFELARFDTKSIYNFVMVGDKEDVNYLNKLISKKPNNVKLLGKLSFNDALNIFNKATFFVNTSRDEGFPNTYIQAWLRGIPVISLGVDPDNIIQKYKLGYVCKNIESVWKALNHLLDNKKEYFDIAERAKKYSKQNHSISKMVNTFLRIMEENLYKRKKVLLDLSHFNQNSEEIFRFGIICDSLVFKSWEVECIKQVLDLKYTSLELVILPSKKIKYYKNNLIQESRYYSNFNKLFFRMYQKLFIDTKHFKKDLSNEFKNVNKIYWPELPRNNFSKMDFLNKVLKRIKNKRLDFILSFSKHEDMIHKILNISKLNISKYGIWTFHLDDEEKYRGNAPCFWEIYNRDNINGAILKKLTPDKKRYVILKQGFFKTINYSYKRNLNNVQSLCSSWVKQVCLDLKYNNADYLSKMDKKTNAKYYGEPNNIEFIKFYFILLKNRLLGIFRKYFLIEQWNVGYINKPLDQFIENGKEFKVNWLFPLDKSHSCADPFPVKWQDKIYIFFEMYKIKKNKGEIGLVVFDKSQILVKNIKTIMSKQYHLSYPFIFNYKNEIYLLPESITKKEIILYKAVEFPFAWEKEAVLIRNFACSDPTIFFYTNFWWLACSGGNGEKNNKLYVFYSEDLYGPWYPHKKNPVKIDIGSARPAGRVFEYKGRLIRPSQDCSKTYGRRIIINEILKLTPFEFKERIIKIINPDYNSCFDKGIHTFNPIGDIIIVDGKKDLFLFNKFLIKRKTKYIQQYT